VVRSHGPPAGPAAEPEPRHCARSGAGHPALGLRVAARRVVCDADPVAARVDRLSPVGAIPIAVPVAESAPAVFAVAVALPVAGATFPVSVSVFPVAAWIAVAVAVRVVAVALPVGIRVVFRVGDRFVFRVGVRVVFRVGGLLTAEKKRDEDKQNVGEPTEIRPLCIVRSRKEKRNYAARNKRRSLVVAPGGGGRIGDDRTACRPRRRISSERPDRDRELHTVRRCNGQPAVGGPDRGI
jgi:hypothetical protein